MTKKTVRIRLFKDNGKYSAPVFVGLNEYTALIPRGVDVDIPEDVAIMLEESQKQEENTALLMTRLAGEFEEANEASKG